MNRAVCTEVHPVDLDDGRSVSPGEEAQVDFGHDHNYALLEAGSLTLADGEKMSAVKAERKAAAKEKADKEKKADKPQEQGQVADQSGQDGGHG